MRRVNQKKLNEDVMAYCDIAWGLKAERERRSREPIYRNIELLSPPQTPNGENPIVMCNEDFRIFKPKVEVPEPKVHWLVRLYRKVRGLFK